MSVVINEETVSVALRVHPRARNYRLTLAHGGRPVLTVPTRGHLRDATDFLHRQKDWLAGRLDRDSELCPFVAGASVPLRGLNHQIVSRPALRGFVEIQSLPSGPVLNVPGGPEHLARRLTDWLKAEALRDIDPAVAHYAAILEVYPKGITIRGQSSRWGSCSSAGRLNFNWRLVLAPPFVLEYVAAHEVAHLVEMNHSPAFWAQVSRALPDMDRGRNWLKAHGHQLMSYGVLKA